MGVLKRKKKEEEAPVEVEVKVTNQTVPTNLPNANKAKPVVKQIGHQSRDFRRPLKGI